MWDKLALILLIIGGINWGLVGIFEFETCAYSSDNRRNKLGTGRYI